ncbi:MAG: glycosyltransferase [Anaerolineae bacterium]|nr:glycosyltransferase [Anaerolineae bacterium]NIN95900.1 glycosyltransferase [Anaerolineae bacterium]NIQ78873.1 glycosyltransferase [Anaerolineae bacterium]
MDFASSNGISAFFPAYNDGGTIASMVLSAVLVLQELTEDYEVIVVNDGSSDYTKEILDELERQYDSVRVVHHEKNRGYGGALRTGFSEASKEFIFYTDGDAQYDVRDLPTLWTAMDDRVDMVQGYKIGRADPLHRVIIGRIYHWVANLAFGLHLKDVDCDFRLIRHSVFDTVHLKSDSGVICVEMMKKIRNGGFRISEVPVHHYHRAYGQSQFFNYRRIFRVGRDLLKLWWELRLPQLLGREVRADGTD